MADLDKSSTADLDWEARVRGRQNPVRSKLKRMGVDKLKIRWIGNFEKICSKWEETRSWVFIDRKVGLERDLLNKEK